GRVVRGPGGAVERVVETKDATGLDADVLAIREVNTGVFAFDPRAVLEALPRVAPVGAEVFLPDVLELLDPVATFSAPDATPLLGVNDRVQLAAVREEAQRRIQRAHMLAGVTIVQPASTSIDVDVAIGADSVIEPCTQLRGDTRVGAGATVGPHSTVTGSLIGDGAQVVRSHVVECEVRAGASVGPFAYLRPGTLLRERAKAGTFVEIKNSDVGEGAKVPHLSYVGDADVGEETNLGAGTITANYDYVRKNRTTIGARVKGGVHVSYIAPVLVDDDAWTAAGSVIGADVPPGALGVARARQRNIEGYAARRAGPTDA
ncbi:MAG TPA: UDP-N-acetylglucosamine diphosphorylase/glucosamine-1-phosphate N-acetyltransferase, partial [Solirubrobacteraceae bacterium]|nr:UDP-N-acetylglucosamine diphosphorylase/glucosamine-1-phosphate N-acetyltransferase [Solirubrobacteraceae bacterium]